jgi:hypothetical protein
MHVEYYTSEDLDVTRIYCDRCGNPVWRVEGRLTDSHLEASSGAVCLCERCAKYMVDTSEQFEEDAPF